MLSLSAKIRQTVGKKVKNLREQGFLPAVLYGPERKNLFLKVDLKEFEKIYKEVGESTLLSLEVPEKKLKAAVLIYSVQLDPITDLPLHIDFLQPSLEEEIETEVSLVFEGESRAIEDLEGTLVKNITEVKVRALPRNLPHEIKVNIESLETLEDEILIKDLKVPPDVKILKEPEEIVANVSPPERIEEEIEKPIEEKVEEVEKVEEKKEEEKEEAKAKPKGEQKAQ